MKNLMEFIGRFGFVIFVAILFIASFLMLKFG